MSVTDIDLKRLRKRAQQAGIEDWDLASADELRAKLARVGWTAELATRRDGTIIGDERNILAALRSAPELAGLTRFDEFSLQVQVARSPPWREVTVGEPWIDDDDTALAGWLQAAGVAVRGTAAVAGCVSVAAKDSPVHPVRAWLDSLEWDGTARLNTWLADYLGAAGDPDYLAGIGRCWLISAVARILRPGCKADYTLTLESSQGIRKSMTAASLAVSPNWFCDSVGDLHSKDAAIQLRGKWIIELAELNSFRGFAQVEAVKAYLTRTHDVYRPPYGRRAVTVPRQCVFMGTTNERQYLRDRTGNRRFWPVRCTSIDIDRIERDRRQLWAEATHAYRTGEQWWLTPELEAIAADEQDDRLLRTEADELVAEYLDRRAANGQTEVTTRDVFCDALGFDLGSDRYADLAQKHGTSVAAAIEAAGWTKMGRRGRKNRTTYQNATGVDRVSNPPLRARARGTGEKGENTLSTPVANTCARCAGDGCRWCEHPSATTSPEDT